VSFVEIELKIFDKTEIINVYPPQQKLWNGYLIIFDEIGWDGNFVKLTVKKVGEPKITEGQALDIVEKYCESELKLSQKDMNDIQMSVTDMGGYYSVSLFNPFDLQTEISSTFKVDKFTGKIVK
jgi:hypothetical protein